MSELFFIDSKVKMPMTTLPVKTPVVKINNSYIILSPGSQIKEEQYDKQWTVTDIVATNLFHHAGVSKVSAIYPTAKIWGVKTIERKAPQIKWNAKLFEDQWPYQEELMALPILGMPAVKEVVFYHKESKTLLATDLFFNLKDVKDFGGKIIFNIFGTYNKFGVSRLVKMATKNENDFLSSINKIFDLDINRLAVSHGEILEKDVKKNMKAALAARGYKV